MEPRGPAKISEGFVQEPTGTQASTLLVSVLNTHVPALDINVNVGFRFVFKKDLSTRVKLSMQSPW